jgi:hypothetical protein
MAKAKIEITNGTQGRGFQVEKKLRMDVLKRRSEPVGGIAVMRQVGCWEATLFQERIRHRQDGSWIEFNRVGESFGLKCRVVPSAYLQRVPHQRADLVQALSLHRRLVSERVPVVQARPGQSGLFVHSPPRPFGRLVGRGAALRPFRANGFLGEGDGRFRYPGRCPCLYPHLGKYGQPAWAGFPAEGGLDPTFRSG